MTPYYLKFASEQEAITVLGAYYVNGAWLTDSHSHCLYVVGTIMQEGVYDGEGNELVAPVPLDGFHVNFLGSLPDMAKPYQIYPNSPSTIFALDL